MSNSPRRAILFATIALLSIGSNSESSAQRFTRGWIVNPLAPSELAAPLPVDSVRVLPASEFIPFRWYALRTYDLGSQRPESISGADTAAFIYAASRFGANALIFRPAGRGYEVVAARITAVPLAPLAVRAAPDSADTVVPGASGGSSAGGATAGCVGACSVHVRGYTRKDGTYVRPHTRNAPRSGGRRP